MRVYDPRWYRKAAIFVACVMCPTATALADSSEWAKGFANPPASARPHVWWHWMDGNVDPDGARRDLEWMAQIGVGEAHIFEGSMGTPTVVRERSPFMTPGWQATLRASVETANRLGLKLGISTSAGWSATGGPWVAPVDAMKKLVWSVTDVSGGHDISINLKQPPGVAGPYQDIALSQVSPGEADPPLFYRDIRVLAFPVPQAPLQVPAVTTSDGTRLPYDQLHNGQFADAANLHLSGGQAWVAYHYDQPQTVRSVVVGLPIASGFGAPRPPLAALEASDDGLTWRNVADLAPTPAPARTMPARTASFPAITANWFRLQVVTDATPGQINASSYAPGALPLSFPTSATQTIPLSEFALSGEASVNRAPEKAGFSTLPDYAAAASATAGGINPETIIDLTAHFSPDGMLAWSPPPGQWRIVRLGWSLTGHRNGPAPAEATGLEVDKLSSRRVAAYLDHYLDLYRAVLGPNALGEHGLSSLLSDSIEAGPQNWTEALPAEFAERRGYDPTRWLPVLTGIVVGDAHRSDAFLYDWRQTIAELYADAHYGTIAAIAKANGLSYSAEALEDHRPQLGDDMAMRARADIPMGAMWVLPADGKPLPTYVADIKGAASVANLYGKPVVAAESLSAFGHPWAYAPRDLKSTVDLEFALGVNRIHIHESAHQPLKDAAPGLALAPFLGQYFNRNETWAPMADGWISYLGRSSYLLQQGQHRADIAYFYGEDAPLTSVFGDRPVGDVPLGYDYDFVNAEALATRLSVHDGRLVTPDGQYYRLLYLGGDSQRITLASLHKIRDLLDAGAVVIGKRPVGSPSLGDNPTEVATAIAAIWDTDRITTGGGRLYSSSSLEQAVATESITPDWVWKGDGELAIQHRTAGDGDIWFIANRTDKSIAGTISLRTSARKPELWFADTGKIAATSYTMSNGRTAIPLVLAEHGAIFIVARSPTATTKATVPAIKEKVVVNLSDRWHLRFQDRRGAPTGDRAADLGSWAQSADPGVRFFSGIGTYRRSITLQKNWAGARRQIMLDLGEVHDVADVFINGARVGVAWKAPYRVDVTGLLRPGHNTVAIRVANVWANRLIGDAQPNGNKVAFVTGPTYAAGAQLRPSGLLGPVKLVALMK